MKLREILFGTDGDAEDEETGKGQEEINDLNKELLAPSYTQERRNRILVGENGQWTRTFFTNNWPDQPQNQFLDQVINRPAAHNDMSLHIEPKDKEAVIRSLKRTLNDLEREMASESDFLGAQTRQEKIDNVRGMLTALQGNTDIFEIGMYTAVRADSEEGLNDASDKVIDQMESAPAMLSDPVIASHAQFEALKSVSPIAKDFMKDNKNFETRTKIMGGAIGAMLPFTSKTYIEEEGVEFGVHSSNGSPVIVDRWGLGNGYNQLTIGKIGAGKSFATKLNILRTYASRDDVVIFMLDPLEGFANINKHLDGEHIPVGGGKTLNPLDISAPKNPEEIKGESDPLANKIKSVKTFIRTFMEQRDKDPGEEMEIITDAINRAYRKKGITQDPTTHDKESPTMKDVLGIIENMTENPEEYVRGGAESEPKRIASQATDALYRLQEFIPGKELDYLTGETEIDMQGGNVIYLDLQQQESSGTLGLMMQVLFEQVYQRSKETDKKVLFAIDEAHYIMDESESLEFLAQAVRHSRHYDLSMNFITQTAREFMVNEKAEDIADQIAIKHLFRTPSLSEEAADKLGLNEPEKEIVRTAKKGDKERGFSGSLLGVENEFMPVQVHASEFEQMLVEMWPQEIAGQIEGYSEEE